MFNKSDLLQFRKKGISLQEVERQIGYFKTGFPAMKIIRAAQIGNGIKKLSETEKTESLKKYESKIETAKLLKFVPASGAATRMFKELFEFRDKMKSGAKADELFADKKTASVKVFFENIRKFAFFEALQSLSASKGMGLETLLAQKEYHTILDLLLEKDGLGYGVLPKGLLKFHKYDHASCTAVEEHLVEGAHYAKNKDKTVHIHFTVSPEHKTGFKKEVTSAGKKISKKYGVRFNVSYSEQMPSTDTIAVDMDNQPFREKDGKILFRPGGHGALLSNLNQIQADCIFIKNIDNIAVQKFLGTTVEYKKTLAGVMFSLQEKIFSYIKDLQKNFTPELAHKIVSFYKDELSTQMPEGFDSWDLLKKKEYLFKKLNRPVRVCGMVKADGDTGGGPFISLNPDGSISPQVVETAQIDLKNPSYKAIFENSTHFSPADFALGVKDYKGKKFDLMKFRDPATGFIAIKSKGGRDLKAQELPGLWNGSMSDWNTAFIDVPAITFNPVKSVVDLLKEAHGG